MKKTITFLLAFFASYFLQAQVYSWTKNIPGVYGFGQSCTSVASDKAGNVYLLGNYTTTRDFDPGPLTYNLNGVFNIVSGYILKLNSNGEFIWAKPIYPSTAGQYFNPKKIAVDTTGHVCITGEFNGTVYFNPNAAVNNSTSLGFNDIFVAKYDTNGNYQWHQTYGSAGTETGRSITMNKAGTEIYVTGEFEQTVDFDASASTNNLTSSAAKDGFILKLDGDGNYQWVTRIAGSSDQLPVALAIDIENNILVAGTMQGTTAFANGGVMNITSNGLSDAFVAKYAGTDGSVLWAKRIGGVENDQMTTICADYYTNSIYVGGHFTGTVDMDPGPDVSNSSSLFIAGLGTPNDVFVVKLNGNGEFVRKQLMQNVYENTLADMEVDKQSKLYLTGNFFGDMNLGNGNVTAASYDGFIAKYDSAGNFVWSVKNGGGNNDVPMDIEVNENLDILNVGTYNYGGPGYAVPLTIGGAATSPLSMLGEESIMIQYRQRTPQVVTLTFPNWQGSGLSYYAIPVNTSLYTNQKNTSVIVEYGTTASLGSSTDILNSTTNTTVFTASTAISYGYKIVNGLLSNTMYYFRIKATNEFGDSYSPILTASTLVAPVPVINALDPGIFGPYVSNITNNAATISNYEVSANGLSTNVSIEYGSTINYGSTVNTSPATITGSALVPVSAALSNLTFGTYHYRVKATNAAGTTYSNDYSFTISIPLPLTWLSFTATDHNNHVSLSWETSNEVNNTYFEVERSMDARIFTPIGEISSLNRNANNVYYFDDYDVLDQPALYYRIKQVDADGKYTYSAIQKILRHSTSEIYMYPNPATTHLAFYNPSNETLQVSVYSLAGQLLLQTTMNSSDKLNINSLCVGNYILKYTNQTSSFTTTFVKK